MQLSLKPHPDSPRSPATHVGASLARPTNNILELTYTVLAPTADLRLPPKAASTHADGLWRHTCLEAFFRPPSGDVYFEFNFSPSTQWAAYRFDDYRKGMTPVTPHTPPRVSTSTSADGFTLHVVLPLDPLMDIRDDATWRFGLSAVIEDAGGAISYWALAHAPGTPDFHHADGFVGHVPTTRAP